MTCDYYTKQLNHLIMLAKSPLRPWNLHAWERAGELERDPSGLWVGMRNALTEAMTGPGSSGESGPQKTAKRL